MARIRTPLTREKPLIELNSSPSYEDLYGDLVLYFDDFIYANDEHIEDMVQFTNLSRIEDIVEPDELYKMLKSLPSSEKEDAMEGYLEAHEFMVQDDAEIYWNDNLAYLAERLHMAGFEDGTIFYVTAYRVNWRGSTGYRSFKWDGTGNQFVRETFAKQDSNFIARIWSITEDGIEASVSSHDVPMGSTFTIQRPDYDELFYKAGFDELEHMGFDIWDYPEKEDAEYGEKNIDDRLTEIRNEWNKLSDDDKQELLEDAWILE